ncbi:MAG: MFS transporter [Firmicutes bacterium]|nr:MFS transporter [Bacillota bacterium]
METKKLWSRNFFCINLCVIFASFTNFAYIYVLPVHMLRIGGSATNVGLMGAALTIVGLITRLTLSPLIDRWGRKPMLVLGGILFALNSLGYLLLKDMVWGVILMRCISGFSQGILFPVPPTIVSDISPKEKLVDALGYFGIASSLPAIFSSPLGLFLYEQVSPDSFFIVTLIMSCISVVFGFLYKDEYVPQPAEEKARRRFSLGNVLEFSVLIPCLVFLLAIFGFSVVNNFVIPFGESRAIVGMSWFFTVHNIAIIITRLFANRLKKILSSRKIIIFGLAVIGGGTILTAFAGSFWMMMLASVIMAVGGTLYSQYLQADILLMTPSRRRGVASSTMMLFQDIGGGAGAALFGVTSEQFGYPFSFVTAGIVTLSAIPLALFGRKGKEQEE